MTSIPTGSRPHQEEIFSGVYECLSAGRQAHTAGSFSAALEWIGRQRHDSYSLVLFKEPDGSWEPSLAKGESTPAAREAVLDSYGLTLPEDGTIGRHA